MTNPTISRLIVEGLHQQYDVDLHLKPGLNVLYGKNGRGKTTILHILANILELDFERFRFLQFEEILINTHEGSEIRVTKARATDSYISVFLDGMKLGGLTPTPELSPQDAALLQGALGLRPVYLPAFRSILERVRSDIYPEPSKESDYDLIRNQERRLQVEGEPRRNIRIYSSSRFDAPSMTARKTIQCREWFGSFVPIIRYPSITDVTDRLGVEYRDAQLEIGTQQQRMLSQTFVGVFKALLSEDDVPTESEVDVLLERVKTALEKDEGSNKDVGPDHLSALLANELSKVEERKQEQYRGSAAELRVLRVYAQMLERRNDERMAVFAKVRLFEGAVNKFLDEKTLHITDDRGPSKRVSGAYVESLNGRKYPLTSLSSGERQVLTMLFSAARMGTASGTFLIDEPELSLHVDWQRIILSELMAQAGRRQIIACTHSPEVGADHSDSLQMFAPLATKPRQQSLDSLSESETSLDDLL